MAANSFSKRGGTTDLGKLYEDLVVAHLVLDLVLSADVSNFNISSNDKNFGEFDDVVLEVESPLKSSYAIQLKHHNKRTLGLVQLSAEKGNFSLKKYFKSYSKIKERENYKFVLLTNLQFATTKNVKINFEDDSVELEVVAIRDWLFPEGLCFKFVAPGLKGTRKTFFESFLLVTDQPNVKRTKDNILAKFQKKLLCRNGVEEYLKFISRWSQREGEKEQLNKPFMQEVILLSVLNKAIKPLSFGATSADVEVLREAFDSFPVTCIDEENYEVVKTMWRTTRAGEKVRERYQLLEDDDGTLSRLAWLADEAPLVVSRKDAIQLCPNKRFVLLNSTTEGAFRCLTDLRDKPQLYEKIVTSLKLSIQGKAPISLKELIGDHHELEEVFTTDALLRISRGSYHFEGGEQISQRYINRFLWGHTIDGNFLKMVDISTTIILDCFNLETKKSFGNFNFIDIPEFLEKRNGGKDVPLYHSSPCLQNFTSGPNVFVTSSLCSHDDFLKVCEFNGTDCHQLRLEATSLQWIRSRGNTRDLDKYRTEDDVEETTLYGDQENAINVVIGDPGMGKTELLKKLKNHSSAGSWGVLMTPKDITSFCAQNEDILEFVLRGKSEVERAVVQHLVKQRKVVFFWDGLDEISRCDLETIIGVIKSLQCGHWIAANTYLKTLLERSFDVLVRTISPFNNAQLDSYFRRSGTDIQRKFSFFQTVLKDSDMLSIPLQISMLTELTTRKRTVSVPDLFEHIIEDKFERYYSEKAGVQSPNDALKEILKIHKKSMYKKYESAALKMFVSPERLPRDVDSEGFQTEADCLGLVKETHDFLKLNQIFAEFLVANYFLEHPEGLKNTILKPEGTRILFFHDLLVKRKDKTPTFVLPVEHLDNFYVVDNEDDFFTLKEEADFVEAARHAELLNDSHTPQTISVLYFCTKFGYDVFEKFPEIPLVKTRKGSSLLHLAVTCNRENIVKRLLSVEAYHVSINDTDGRGETALYKACKNGFFNISTLLLTAGADFHHGKPNGSTPLYTACLHNHPEIVQLLIDHHCQVDGGDSGPTPLHAACWNGHLAVVQLLLKHGADVNAFFEGTPLHLASRNNHSAVVELLLQSEVDVNRAQEDGVTALFLASQEGSEENVKLLLEADAHVNLCTKSGESPLYIACQNGHEAVARMLIDHGGDVNVATTSGWTPLQIAAQKNYSTIVKLLVGAGAGK